jgi:adenylate cyclase
MSKKILFVLVIFVFSMLCVLGLSRLGAIRDLENQTIDVRQLAFAPETKSSEAIVMVWLDETTMNGLPYRSPVPRNFLADLNDSLFARGAKLVAYDIFFKGNTFKQDDEALAKSLSGKNVFAVIPSRPLSFCSASLAEKFKDASICADLPEKIFQDSLVGIGLADLPFSAFDANVRRAKFNFLTNLGQMSSIAAGIFKAVTGEDAFRVVSDKSLQKGFGPIKFTPFASDDGQIPIRFAGPPSKIGGKENRFRVFSAKMVADGLIPKSWIQDKIVLVGAAFDDGTDAFMTPYYGRATNFARMFGVEIHANILSSLLTRQFLFSFAPWQKIFAVGVIVLLIGASSFLFLPIRSSLVFMVLMVSFLFFSIYAFRSHGVIVPIVLPTLSAFFAYGFGIGLRALTEGRQKRFIKSVFSKYVPPAVVERMTQNPKMLKLGGEKRNVTSLFSDIASFTTISEKMDPQMLVSFLNDYLGMMNDILFKYGATLDKYEGDAIIAFFNAPLDVEGHELAAGKSAVEMKRAGLEITKRWKEKCGREIVTRVGLHSGPAVVGNMGSMGRFDYTAIGDTINLASRLEGANKFYGTVIMASETTVSSMGESSIVTRPVDRVRVKGKAQAIGLFEIIGYDTDCDQKMLTGLIEPYRRAFDLFLKRDIGGAMDILKLLSNNFPDDIPTLELLKRCDRAIIDSSWDLVTDMVSK